MNTNLILVLVQIYSSCMRKNNVMGYHIGFCCWVSSRAGPFIVRTSTRRHVPGCITFTTECIWLVKGHPLLHSVAKFFEAEVGIVSIIIPNDWSMKNCQLARQGRQTLWWLLYPQELCIGWVRTQITDVVVLTTRIDHSRWSLFQYLDNW